jgi:hypothetical protein
MAFVMLFIAQNRICAKKVRLEVTKALAQYFVTVIQNQRAAAQATFDVPSKPLPRATGHGRHESLPNKGVQHLVLKFRLMPQVVLHAHNLHSPQPIMDTINTSFSILYRSKVHGLNT